MVEAGGYLFRDIEALMEKSENELMEFRDSENQDVYLKHKEDLVKAVKEMSGVCERYKDDIEAQVLCEQMNQFLGKVEEGDLTIMAEIKAMDRIIERLHHMVEWRRIAIAEGHDIPFKDRRTMREGQTLRSVSGH